MRVGYRWKGCLARKAARLPGSSSLGLRRSQAGQDQPVRMTLAGHQIPWALALAFGASAAQEAAVVQKEAQQVQVRATEVATQGEVGAQPRVQVLGQRSAARRIGHGPAHGREEGMELAAHRRAKPVPSLPVCGRVTGQAVQQACFTHEESGDGVGVRDGGQLGIEHAGEGEQVVALFLQGDLRRVDASEIRRLAQHQLRDKEVEQCLPRGRGWSGQRKNVMAQPLGERPDVAGQFMRLGFGLSYKRQMSGKLVVGTPLAGASGLCLQRLAS